MKKRKNNKQIRGLRKFFPKFRLLVLEGLHLPHLQIRLVHDKTYAKGGKYKKWTDKPYSGQIHKATAASFLVSFVIFTLVQGVFPNLFNLTNPNLALAGSDTVTWTTQDDFENNAVSTGAATTISGDISFTGDSVKIVKGNGPNIQGDLDNIASITSSLVSSSGFDNNGNVWQWGENTLGSHVLAALKVPYGDGYFGDVLDIVSISGGGGQTLALDSNGNVWQWGTVPTRVPGEGGVGYLSDIVKISAYGDGADADAKFLALDSNGNVWQWAQWVNNGYPFKVPGEGGVGYLSNIVDVSANQCATDHFLAIDNSGNVWAWGRNEYGQLGNNTTTTSWNPVKVLGENGVGYLSNIIQVDSGGNGDKYGFSIALDSNGNVWAWGINNAGQLGINNTTNKSVPVKVLAEGGVGYLSDITSVSAAYYASFASDSSGNAWAWGDGWQMGLGNGSTADKYTPIKIPGISGAGYLSNIIQVDGRYAYGGNALDSSGQVYAWGLVSNAGVGDGTNLKAAYPVKVIYDYSPIEYTTSTISNLQIDAGADKIASWADMSWNTTALPASTAVKFRVRSADTEANLSSASWSSFFIQDTETSTTGMGDLSGVTVNRWLEIEATLESTDGVNTPTLNDFTVSYDTLESPQNSNVVLTKTDSTNLKDSSGTTIAGGDPGAWTNESTLRVTANSLTCTDCGTSTNIRPEVEIEEAGVAFDSSDNIHTADPGNNYVDIPNLSDSTDYHIQVRAIDDQGRVSAWTPYGGNADPNGIDVSVDQSAPTVDAFTINSDATYTDSTTVTLNIEASDADSKLSKVYASNNGSDWTDITPGSGFAGEATFNDDISWDIPEGDVLKTVYVKVEDNGGNESGKWTQTTDIDFNEGIATDIDISDDTFLISRGAQKNAKTYADLSDIRIYYNAMCSIGLGSIGESTSKIDVVSVYGYGCKQNTKTLMKFPTTTDFEYISIDNVSLNVYYYEKTDTYNANAIVDHIPDWGSPDTSDFNTTPYSANIGTIATPSTPYGYISLPVTNYFLEDKDNSRSFSSYRLDVSPKSPPASSGPTSFPGRKYNIYTADRSGTDYDPYIEIDYTSPNLDYGTFESSVKDNGSAMNYGTISWTADIPTETGSDVLRFQVASNNDDSTWNYIGPDGTAGSYYDSSGTQLHSSHNGDRYIRYKAYLQTADADYTPTVYDVSIEIPTINSDQITLDTAPPAAFDLSSPDNNTWGQDNDPSLTWGASSDSNDFTYQLWVDDELDTTDIDSGTTNITPTDVLTEANHTWYVKAVDGAGNETVSNQTWNVGYDNSAPSLVLDPGFSDGFTATNNQASEIDISWDTYADDSGNGSPATIYTLERITNDDYVSEVNIPGGHTLTSDWSLEDSYTNLGNQTSPYEDSAIEESTKYQYRIKVTDAAGNVSDWLVSDDGMTTDGRDPDNPGGVNVVPCLVDGTNCSDGSDPDPNAGYELKLTWDPSYDSGSGVTGYRIYRALTNSTTEEDYTVVGYLDQEPGNPAPTVWYDNDTNNAATYQDTLNGELTDVKAKASTTLNDYVTYHYRITAFDASGNESPLLTGTAPFYTEDNYAEGSTIDVTDPSVPSGIVVSAGGTDPASPDPENPVQMMDVSWGASTDFNDQLREPDCIAGTTGCSIKEYVIYRSSAYDATVTDPNTFTPDAGDFSEIDTITSPTTTFHETDLAEYSYYWYKIKSIDKALNESTLSAPRYAYTFRSTVPNTISPATVEATKGDTNPEGSVVGEEIEVTFNGSYSKNAQIVSYDLYRSTTAPSEVADDAAWLATATNLTTVNITPIQDDRTNEHSYSDSDLTGATTYYYRVIATDNTPGGEGGPYTSGLSGVNSGSVTTGWDTTPDNLAPDAPGDVVVKDIHKNTSMYRNIITWTTIADSQRNGVSDFSHYEVWRYETDDFAGTLEKRSTDSNFEDRDNNYLVDGIDNADGDIDYTYFVRAVDNADTEYKYPNETVINNYANYSTSQEGSITPATAFPTVSNVSHSNVGVSSATVEWDTDQPCDSLVEYRVKNSATVKAAGGNRTTPVTDHEIGLVGLSKSTEYEYRVVSRNSLGNIDTTAATTWREFETTAFSITHNKSTDLTLGSSSVTVKWTTNINADSAVEYQIVTKRGVPVSEDSDGAFKPGVYSTSHSVSFNVVASSKYVYKIRSITEDGYVAEYPTSGWLDFTTPADDNAQFTVSPDATKIAEENITATSARIVWESAIPTTSWIDYGLSSKNYTMSAGDNQLNTHHVVDLKNLTPGQKYYYIVRGTDANENEYKSSEYSFTAVLLPIISKLNIDVVDSYTTKITFNTNVDTEASATFGKDGKLDQKSGSGELRRNHEIVLNDLEDNTSYSYYIEAKDQFTNSDRTATKVFTTPLDKEGAKVENLKIDILSMGESDETASVIISWNTNKPTTTKVEYDEGVISEKLGKSTIEDDSLNTSHTVIIKELTPSTTYKFKIAGTDKRGNLTDSNSYTFVTPTRERSIWQLILRSIEETFSWVKNVGGFFRR